MLPFNNEYKWVFLHYNPQRRRIVYRIRSYMCLGTVKSSTSSYNWSQYKYMGWGWINTSMVFKTPFHLGNGNRCAVFPSRNETISFCIISLPFSLSTVHSVAQLKVYIILLHDKRRMIWPIKLLFTV